jgi:signal transduction histidine kinase/CheY-like chemotaxis protein
MGKGRYPYLRISGDRGGTAPGNYRSCSIGRTDHIEDEFSYTLGEGSRWLSDLILKLLLSLVLTVEVCGLSVTILVSRGIARGLNNIIQSSEKIAAGDFSGRAKVFSQDEIGILANSFNEMTDKLQLNIDALKRSEEALIASKEVAEQSAIVKEHFLANMSHEIRTPMNAVIGFANLLENTTLDDHQQQFVNAIKISGQNLMAIINDILDYSKIESGKIIIEQIPFSITHVFEGVRVLMSRKAVEKRLELKVSVDAQIPGTLLGDPMRLTQVLLNLTDNALKFTEKGEVALSATMVKTTDQAITVQFRIADTGVGIVPEKLPIIFDRFTQGSTETTRKHGGTGLGLSIAQSLVDLQGGNIAVESKIGQGTVFAFSITYTRAKPEQTMVTVNKKRDQVVERAEPIWVLLAEDNPVNQSLVVYVLKKSGIETDIADNGAIAIEKMKSGNYDLVLMDIQMPEMDGYEATSIIRKELHSNIPIIALTAHALNEEKEKCLRLGMNDYLSKPFDPKELYNKIVAACAA